MQSLKELETVINHFYKFPLNTKKKSDFKLLKMVIIKIKRKENLTLAGLRKIVAIKAAMSAPQGQHSRDAIPGVGASRVYAHPNRPSERNLKRPKDESRAVKAADGTWTCTLI